MAIFGKRLINVGVHVGINDGVVNTGTINGPVIVIRGRSISFAELTLHWREPNDSIASLLKWNSRLTALFGRDEELQNLREWAESDAFVSVRLLHGAAGVGKTRLAGELAQTLRDSGWEAGQISLDTEALTFRIGGQGTLLLVDYAEENRSAVLKFLKILGRLEEPRNEESRPAAMKLLSFFFRKEKPKNRVRVILLSRQPMEQWQTDFHMAHAINITDTPLELASLVDLSLWNLFSYALCRANEVLGQGKGNVPITEKEFGHWSKQNHLHERPLFVLAYAVQMAIDPQQRKLQGPDIFNFLTAREEARWQEIARDAQMNENTMARLKALSAITGSLTAKQLRGVCRQDHFALYLSDMGDPIDQLRRTGEFEGNHFPPLEPELLAANVLHNVLDRLADKAGEWIWSAIEQSSDSEMSLYRVSRLSYDMSCTLGLSWPAEALADAVHGHRERCEFLVKSILSTKLAPGLFPLAVSVWQTLVDSAQDEPTRAYRLLMLSNSQASNGDREKAVDTGRESVRMYEQLVLGGAAQYQPFVARGLNNLSNRLKTNGEHAEAAAAIQRAVDIYESLTNIEEATYESELARSLYNLADHQAAIGKYKAGLVANIRSVEIYERLPRYSKEIYEPDYVNSLIQLSIRYGENLDPDKAFEAIRKAVDICVKLVDKNRSAYEPVLAIALENLSGREAEQGIESALGNIERVVEIYKRLANQNRAAYEPHLARSYINLSIQQAYIPDHRSALESARYAVQLYEKLVERNQAAFQNELAASYRSLVNRLDDICDYEEALWVIGCAVDIYQRLSKKLPAAYDPDLAISLQMLSVQLWSNGVQGRAIEVIQRAVGVFERLVETDRKKYLGNLYTCEYQLASFQRSL